MSCFNSLDIQFTVDGVAVEESCAYLLNIYKNNLPVVPLTKIYDNDIPLAHVGKLKNITPSSIIDSRYRWTKGAKIELSGDVRANYKNTQYMKVNNNVFNHPSKHLYLTNVVNDFSEPLFYKHVLSSGITDDGFSIVDNEGKSVNNNKYKSFKEVDSTSATHDIKQDVIVHNLVSNKDKQYFVIYNQSGTTYKKILNTKPLFEKDVLGSAGFFQSVNSDGELFVYWVNDIGSTFEYKMPTTSGTVYFKEGHGDYIHARIPNTLRTNDPWFPEVDLFHWKLNSNEYYIREYDDENFCPYKPYMCNVNDSATVVGNHIIQLDKRGVLEGLSLQQVDEYIDIELYKKDDKTPSKALTSRASLVGSAVDECKTVVYTYSNVSVCYDSGLIYVDEDLSEYEWCKVNYPYQSSAYTISDLDLNPFRNESIRGKTVVYYIYPTSVVDAKSIYYIIYDEDLVITETNDPSVTVETMFKYPSGINSVVSSPSVFSIYFISSDVFSDKIYNDEILVLGEFSVPETLEENPYSLTTEYKRESNLDIEKLAMSNPELFAFTSENNSMTTLSLPHFHGLELVKIHWGMLQDYYSSAMFTKQELIDRLKFVYPGRTTYKISMEGVPNLTVSSVDFVNNDITIRWIPVLNLDKSTPIKGVLYKGTDIDNITTSVATFNNLADVNQYLVSMSANEIAYFQIQTYFTKDSVNYYGPKSNVLKFSFDN